MGTREVVSLLLTFRGEGPIESETIESETIKSETIESETIASETIESEIGFETRILGLSLETNFFWTQTDRRTDTQSHVWRWLHHLKTNTAYPAFS